MRSLARSETLAVMTDAITIPARLAILCAPGSPNKGVGPDAIEALLTTWLKTPIALGHNEDGEPYLIGAEGKHLSLSHEIGITAIAISDVPIGLATSRVATSSSELRAATKDIAREDRTRLATYPREHRAGIFARLKAKVMARCRLLVQHPAHRTEESDSPKPERHWSYHPMGEIEWRPWLSLASTSRVPAGLMLAAPSALLAKSAIRNDSCVTFDTPNGPLALAIEWATSG